MIMCSCYCTVLSFHTHSHWIPLAKIQWQYNCKLLPIDVDVLFPQRERRYKWWMNSNCKCKRSKNFPTMHINNVGIINSSSVLHNTQVLPLQGIILHLETLDYIHIYLSIKISMLHKILMKLLASSWQLTISADTEGSNRQCVRQSAVNFSHS